MNEAELIELIRRDPACLQTCMFCRFAVPDEGGNFECRRYPPQLVATGPAVIAPGAKSSLAPVRPLMRPENWCGEWAPAPELEELVQRAAGPFDDRGTASLQNQGDTNVQDQD